MDLAIRRFAQKVVAVNAALFLLLLFIVGFASREIYFSAKRQSLDQAKESQALIAAQTARGIEGFYGAILAGLHLVRDAEDELDAEPATTPPTTRPAAPTGGRVAVATPATPPAASPATGPVAGTVNRTGWIVRRLLRDLTGQRGIVFARLVARQLEGRASQVFIFDRKSKHITPVGETDRALPPAEVVAQLADWFAAVEGPEISPFRVRDGVGYNVVTVPTRKNAQLMIVATVPVRSMEARMLDRLGSDGTIASLLADESDTVMAANERAWVGRDLESLGGPLATRELGMLRGEDFRGTHVIAEPFRVGDIEAPPAMFATEPVHVAGERWFLLIASDLSKVDAAVTSLVRRGIGWVVFVILSMTALLVSTSVQLIRNRVRIERERSRALETELEHARKIQLAWLPSPNGAPGRRVDVAAVNHPASHISGDFYNWFDLPDGRTAVVIGDVTGHGMSAAFLMATVQLLVRNTLPRTLDPGRCLEEVNDQLCVQMFHGQFVTMQVLVIDCDTGAVDVATAGHPAPLSSDGEFFQPMKLEPQLVLGIQPKVEYPTERVRLGVGGATMLLYTDGVVDAVSADGKRFDTDNLRDSLDGRYASAAELVADVIASLDTFRGGRDLVDDLTLVAVQLQPARVARTDEAEEAAAAI